MPEAEESEDEFQGGRSGSQRHYSAFLSYTDDDRASVLQLQSRLERFRFPKEIAERLGARRIKPVCVDRSEMRAASDLGNAIKDALGRSDFLIVVCTPRTPESYWVGKEIEYFREIRGDDYVLAALLEGEKSEAFHPQLADLSAGGRREPLAADFRREGDGPRLALLKLLAGLADVDLDELVLRDRKTKRRRQLIAGMALIAFVLLISFLSYRIYRSDAAIDRERILASQAMQQQLEDLRQEVRAGGTLDMARAINRNVELYYEEQATSSALPEVEVGRAELLHAMSETEISSRNFESAEQHARDSWLITSQLHRDDPNNLDFTFAHAQSAFWLAYAAWLQNDTPLAAFFFGRYADLADELAAAEPENLTYVREQAYAYSNLGTLALREARDPDTAYDYFQSSQAAFRRVVLDNPDDTDTITDIADGESWLADVALAREEFETAQRHREEQSRLIERLLRDDPENRNYRVHYLASRIGQARLEEARGNQLQALEILRGAEEEASALLLRDPQNPSYVERKRIVELLQARIELQIGDARALRRAREHVGDCDGDWQVLPESELPVFCTILTASLEARNGTPAAARTVMRDRRLFPWLRSPSLSPMWKLDLQEECQNIRIPALCRVPTR